MDAAARWVQPPDRTGRPDQVLRLQSHDAIGRHRHDQVDRRIAGGRIDRVAERQPIERGDATQALRQLSADPVAQLGPRRQRTR
jgi:hypothetical protein